MWVSCWSEFKLARSSLVSVARRSTEAPRTQAVYYGLGQEEINGCLPQPTLTKWQQIRYGRWRLCASLGRSASCCLDWSSRAPTHHEVTRECDVKLSGEIIFRTQVSSILPGSLKWLAFGIGFSYRIPFGRVAWPHIPLTTNIYSHIEPGRVVAGYWTRGSNIVLSFAQSSLDYFLANNTPIFKRIMINTKLNFAS